MLIWTISNTMSVAEANKKTSEKINPIFLCFTGSKAAVGQTCFKAAHNNPVLKFLPFI
jgi:hypothetical protein